MKNKIKISFPLILLLSIEHAIASKNQPTHDSEETTQTQPSQIIGRWSPNCDRFGGITIHSPKKITIEVNTDQIYILSHGHINNNTLDIFLDHPEDLGRGGMMLNWELFSKSTPITRFTLVSADSAAIEWLGFYNESSKSREWVNDPDFAGPDKLIFSRCNE